MRCHFEYLIRCLIFVKQNKGCLLTGIYCLGELVECICICKCKKLQVYSNNNVSDVINLIFAYLIERL